MAKAPEEGRSFWKESTFKRHSSKSLLTNWHLASCWKNVQREIFRASQAEKVERLPSVWKGLGFHLKSSCTPPCLHSDPLRTSEPGRPLEMAPSAVRANLWWQGTAGNPSLPHVRPKVIHLGFLSVSQWLKPKYMLPDHFGSSSNKDATQTEMGTQRKSSRDFLRFQYSVSPERFTVFPSIK